MAGRKVTNGKTQVASSEGLEGRRGGARRPVVGGRGHVLPSLNERQRQGRAGGCEEALLMPPRVSPQRLCFKLTRSHRCWLAEPGAPRASLGRLAAGGRFAGAAHGASQKPKQGPDPFSPHAHLSHAPWCCRGELQAEAGPAPLSDTPLPTFPAATSSPNHNVAPATVVPNPRPPCLDPRPPRQQKAPAVASRPLLPSPTRPPPPPAPPQARPPFPGCPLLSQLAVTAAEMADD